MGDVERSWVVTGSRYGKFWIGRRMCETSGSTYAVEFDSKWVLNREEKQGDILGWIHTHPGFMAYVSPTDRTTMNAWHSCLGKPLLCLIVGVNGLHGWVFSKGDDEVRLASVFLIGDLIIGVSRA